MQENYFKPDHCTYIYVSQQIYKYATKNKNNKENMQEALAARTTLNLDILQHHILTNFVEGYVNNDNPPEEEVSDDEDDNYVTIYLAENDKKSFNKFVLDTFSEIQHYYKYTMIVVDENQGEGVGEVGIVSE